MKSLNESQRIFVRFIDNCFTKLFNVKEDIENKEIQQDLEFKGNGKVKATVEIVLDRKKPVLKINMENKINANKKPVNFSIKFAKINKDPITIVLTDADGDVMYTGYLKNENREDKYIEVKLIKDKYDEPFITTVLSLTSSILAERIRKVSEIIDSYTDVSLNELIKFAEEVDSFLLTTR